VSKSLVVLLDTRSHQSFCAAILMSYFFLSHIFFADKLNVKCARNSRKEDIRK
jgi:hypothetical protein